MNKRTCLKRKMDKIRKPIVLLFIMAFLSVVLVFLLFGVQDDIDTSSYVQVINYFSGGQVTRSAFFEFIPTPLFRIIKPLGPMLAAPLALLVHPKLALMLENVIFYLGATFLMFKVSESIYQDQKKSLIAAIFFMTAYPTIRWGLSAYVDMSGWFFFLLSVYLSLLFLESRKEWLVWLNGFLSGVGFLFKEPGAVGALFFIAVLLLFKFSWSERIKFSLKFAASFIAISLPVSLFIYHKFDYSLYHWFLSAKILNARMIFSPAQAVLRLIEGMFAMMFLGWFFVLRGLRNEYLQRNKYRLKLLVAFVPPSLFHLVWPMTWFDERLMFIAGPLLCLLAASGMEFKTKRAAAWGRVFMVMAVFFNFAFNYIFPKFIYVDRLQRAIERILL